MIPHDVPIAVGPDNVFGFLSVIVTAFTAGAVLMGGMALAILRYARWRSRSEPAPKRAPEPRCGQACSVPASEHPCLRAPGHVGPCDPGWTIRLPTIEFYTGGSAL